MIKIFAKIVSLIFHPLFFYFYGVILLFNSGLYITYLPVSLKRWIYLIVIVNTILIPVGFLPFYLNRKIIQSVQMNGARERIIPLAVNLILVYISYFLFTRFQVPVLLRMFLLAGAVTNLFVLILSLRLKISLHTSGIGALTGIYFAIAFRFPVPVMYLFFLILMSGIIGSARLKTGTHKEIEIYLGYLTGFISAGLLFYLLL